MITFEQALAQYLASHLTATVGPLIKKNSVTVNLTNLLDTNRWQMSAAFDVTATFSSKLAASRAFSEVDELMKALRWVPGVNWVQLINATAQPAANSGEWTYVAIYQVTHRVRDSWQLPE